ncbi:hypothetical protein AGABI2DRAFT_194991 [Agaricus bisporus var. bisporus H97]|uniref:hypothetical protein n=1 Tax=Agaricus bisporus var. bisporus (strain H97 / ATCC MYA-4626 / FGSC 10389) TaxID=936046 RepID=UPI00029F5EF4|nr:hypothetical protein AGABI2DRAFT_194991 [Agaricus bisporus var. bisporus H97]EKV44208.1 hypothetical protein AGABI2DRAFT_194991 [Agaricus bisporus var. bisporus H97]
MLTLPPLVSNFIIDTDSESESEDDSMPETPPALAPVLPAFLTKPPPSVIALGPNQRAIAGSQRVYRFREMQGVHIGKGGGEVLQSITAAPALGHNSFEELRVECYLQSRFATGSYPKAVDPTKTPWKVIPPMFNALTVKPTIYGVDENDVLMDG